MAHATPARSRIYTHTHIHADCWIVSPQHWSHFKQQQQEKGLIKFFIAVESFTLDGCNIKLVYWFQCKGRMCVYCSYTYIYNISVTGNHHRLDLEIYYQISLATIGKHWAIFNASYKNCEPNKSFDRHIFFIFFNNGSQNLESAKLIFHIFADSKSQLDTNNTYACAHAHPVSVSHTITSTIYYQQSKAVQRQRIIFSKLYETGLFLSGCC